MKLLASTLSLIHIITAFNTTKHIGCVQDSPNRIMESFVGYGISPIKCTEFCSSVGYAYAGVEAGNECYCSRQLLYQPKILDSSACNINCTINSISSDLCGGDWAIDVWELQIQPRNILNKTKYIGCIQDTQDRSIEFSSRHFKLLTNTPEMCADKCDSSNFPFSAVENGEECFCAESLMNRDKTLNFSITFLDESRCRVKCTGSDDYCGGVWAFALRVNSSYPEIDFNYPGSIPPSPNALSLFLSVSVISIASICFLYSVYYIILKREYLYRRDSRMQQINNIIVYAFICNVIQSLVTVIQGLPFSISIFTGIIHNSYNAISIYVQDAREISVTILMGLTSKTEFNLVIATIMRYESLVLIGKTNRATTVCKAIAIFTMLSFFPKLICDILYSYKIFRSRIYVNPIYVVSIVFVVLGILL